jgi:hypothetical protein
MQSKDIQVGQEYARFAYKRSPAQRVKVLSVGVKTVAKRGYGYGSPTKGIEIEFLTGPRVGQALTVRPQEIGHDWATQVRLNDEAKAARIAREDNALKVRTRRAELAARIEVALGDRGVEGTADYCYHDEHRAALEAVGYVFGSNFYTKSRMGMGSLSDLMQSGKVSEKVAAALLGEES